MTDTPESDLDRALDRAVTDPAALTTSLDTIANGLYAALADLRHSPEGATALIEYHAGRVRRLAQRAYDHAMHARRSGDDLGAQWAAGRTRGAAADVAAAVLRQDAAIAVFRRDATRLDATLSDSLVEAIGASIATQLDDAGLLRQPPGGVTKTDLAAARQTLAHHVIGVLHAETPTLSDSLIEAIAGRVADGLIGRGLCVTTEPPTEGETASVDEAKPWVDAAWDLVGHIDRMADQWAAMGPSENMSAEEHERAVAARNLELWDPLHHKARVLDEALTGRSLWLASAYDAAYRPSPEKSEPDMAERAANLREWEDENRADPADQPAATYLRVPFADADGEEGVHVHRADTASARLAVLREVCDMRAAAPLEEVLAVALWVTNGVLP